MTMNTETLVQDSGRLTVHVPLAIRKRGGRKIVVAPEGQGAGAHPKRRVDNSLIKAIARAYRWQRMLESGEFASVSELAAAEQINASYLARVLRLTLLSPKNVEAMLDGRHELVSLEQLMKPCAVEWGEQRIA